MQILRFSCRHRWRGQQSHILGIRVVKVLYMEEENRGVLFSFPSCIWDKNEVHHGAWSRTIDESIKDKLAVLLYQVVDVPEYATVKKK